MLEARLEEEETQRQKLAAAVETGRKQRTELSAQVSTHRISIETLQSVKAERAELQAVADALDEMKGVAMLSGGGGGPG